MDTLSPNDSVALGGLLQLLGRLLTEELNPELVAILQRAEVKDVFECTDYLSQNWTAEAYEQAAIDYCELFILPKGVSPMAGAWLDNTDQAQPTGVHIQSVTSSLTAGIDFDLPDVIAATPPEHAGYLLYVGGQLASASDHELSQQALPFLRATLVPWLGTFAEALSVTTVSPFYSRLGSLMGDTYHQYMGT